MAEGSKSNLYRVVKEFKIALSKNRREKSGEKGEDSYRIKNFNVLRAPLAGTVESQIIIGPYAM